MQIYNDNCNEITAAGLQLALAPWLASVRRHLLTYRGFSSDTSYLRLALP
jgi:hypothetical protein